MKVKGERFIGDLLVHPLALFSLTVLIVNDHVLKPAYGNIFTGKLSDFAGLIFFPLMVVVLAEISVSLIYRSKFQFSASAIVWVIVVVAFGYVAVKSIQSVADAYSSILGVIEWIASAPPKMLSGAPIGPVASRRVIADPSDLSALPMLLVAWFIAGRFRSVQIGSFGFSKKITDANSKW